MSPQYREHGRRKQKPLPPSSVERPWALVRNNGPANQVAYLIREQGDGYVGVLLGWDLHGWELEEARLLFVPEADVLHVFSHEPQNLGTIHEARLKLEGQP
jgi:hypothetical protein